MEETEVCIYADDTTIYLSGQELEQVVSSLENDAQRISNWLFDNSMKLNPDKCHLLTFGGNNADVSVHIGETVVTESVKEKLLGVTVETRTLILRVMLLQHVKKLHKLARISSCMNVVKLRIMMNTFVMSQFSYFTFIWMFHDRSVN